MRRLFVLAALVCLLACSPSSTTPGVGKTVPVPGLGTIGYNSTQLERVEVDIISGELISTRDLVWPQYQAIYTESHDYYMDRITLNTEFYKVAELALGTHKMTLNPSMDYQRGFAAELHNLYRYYVHGPEHIYCDEAVSDTDRARCLAAERVWRGM